MTSRVQLYLTQTLLLLFSITWIGTAEAQKVTVSEAIPNNAEQGTVNLDVEIKGRGFQAGASVAFWRTGTTNPGGITVNAVTVNNSKSLTANIDIDEFADLDLFDIEVFNTNGRKGKGITLFTVKQKGGGNVDTTAPGEIQDFRAVGPTRSTSTELVWTAPGDDGMNGSVDHYMLLSAAQAEQSACDGPGPYDFSSARVCPGEPRRSIG